MFAVVLYVCRLDYTSYLTHISVLFSQDDDVAAVKDGLLSIHRLKRNLDDSHAREITTLKMEIQQIMKGAVSLLCHIS